MPGVGVARALFSTGAGTQLPAKERHGAPGRDMSQTGHPAETP